MISTWLSGWRRGGDYLSFSRIPLFLMNSGSPLSCINVCGSSTNRIYEKSNAAWGLILADGETVAPSDSSAPICHIHGSVALVSLNATCGTPITWVTTAYCGIFG